MESQDIIRSPYPPMQTPNHILIQDLLGGVGQDDDNVFLTCLSSGREYTRGDVITQGDLFGKAIRGAQLGSKLRPGDNVAVILPNIPEYLSILFGCFKSGIIPVLLSPELTRDEILYSLRYVEPKVIVCMPESMEKLGIFLGGGTSVQSLITIGPSEESASCNYFDLIASSGCQLESDMEMTAEGSSSQKVALMLLSSGTTGKPKGVELTHESLIHTIITASKGFDICFGRETFLVPLPFFHVGGLTVGLLIPFHTKCRTVTMHKFSAELFLKGLQEHKITCIGAVPSLLSICITKAVFKREDFRNIRRIIYGGGVGGAGLIGSLRNKFGTEIFLTPIYGMTEFFGGTTVPHNLRDIAEATGSVGLPLPNTMVKIVDIETGHVLGPDQTGEICFKGKQCMRSYYKKGDETAATIDPEGWVHSGDLGYYTSPYGLLYVCGRIKDLIKVNSYQVSPDEIEDTIKRMNGIGMVGVFGIPDPKYGEVPRACIVRTDAGLKEDDVHDFLKDKLVHYKQLKGGVRFVSEIPMSPVGKILRRTLMQMYSD